MTPSTNHNKKDSPNQRAWRRLWKNKPAVFGMVVIACAMLMAVLGYLISPDKTPDVNEQIPEVSLKSPGFEVQMLAIHKNREIKKSNIFKTMLFGKANPYKLMPINNYRFEGAKVIVERYEGDDIETAQRIKGKEIMYDLADIYYPLSYNNKTQKEVAGQLSFYNINEEQIEMALVDLQAQVKKENIYSKTFLLGTDKYGRSMLSRLILGVRISLLVGLIAVFISLTIGITLGAIAGYFGGRVDDLVMLIINTAWSIPTLLLVFAIVLALGRGIGIIFLAVGLTMWVDVARMVRGQVISFKEIQFVEAAQSMGFKSGRIIFRHILPNVLGPVMVIAATTFATAILIEAGLSYLGFGIQPPTPSWGTMLNENYGYAISGKPFLALIPAFAIMMMVLAFNLVGNGFRDALDVNNE